MNNNYYVYIWYIVETSEVIYVGKGKNNRYKCTNRNKFFNDMYKTHNCKSKIVYNNLTENEAFKKEEELIKYYRNNYPNYRLTNQTEGGEGTSGWKAPNEFKQKQQRLSKERWKNLDYRNKMIKIRRDENGVYKSKEFRDKISRLVKGELNPNKGNKWNDEQKQHLREIQKNNDLYKNETNPNAKRVMCLETGEIFKCIKYCLQKYLIHDEASISIALKERWRTASGLHWVKITEQNMAYFKNDENRFGYLIESIRLNKNYKGIICLDDKKIFNNKQQLGNYLNITVSKITWHIKKYGKLKHNNKTYILIKDYKSHI